MNLFHPTGTWFTLAPGAAPPPTTLLTPPTLPRAPLPSTRAAWASKDGTKLSALDAGVECSGMLLQLEWN